jgi:hypothetical protein
MQAGNKTSECATRQAIVQLDNKTLRSAKRIGLTQYYKAAFEQA